ncbi:MAG TPA: ATP-binding protein, partial [Nitrospiria bacterium]|nr:ATP-binding protein [Nitrospiria bacterium]
VKEDQMFDRGDRLLVAVSGGKDSLALWDVLLNLGHRATGLHVDLGIGGYSSASREKTERFASARGAKLIVHSLRDSLGIGVPEIAEKNSRSPCSACGTIKRYSFNQIAQQYGFSVLATGHNLDDEAARLLGNVLHWQEEYLDKQSPVLQAARDPNDGKGSLVKKVKPLYRLAEREMAAYAVMKRIDYVVEECPNAKGAKLLVYKEVLNRLEEEAPGTKQNFYLSFLKRWVPRSIPASRVEVNWQRCRLCGQPTSSNPGDAYRVPGVGKDQVAGIGKGMESVVGDIESVEDFDPTPGTRHPVPELPLCSFCRLMERVIS